MILSALENHQNPPRSFGGFFIVLSTVDIVP
jgi:hypothetical protein